MKALHDVICDHFDASSCKISWKFQKTRHQAKNSWENKGEPGVYAICCVKF